ncbi:hypothetical protein [Aggregatilinea lenta]|uniref:hypothetical protein n=1 Tax=Aggregatilinea lenta TaxID=913108 RepID=UPI000E5A12EB|nr:hypothetical protein [Aggregatilinea lenta]
MATNRVGDLTVDELKALIEAVIEAREARIDPEARRSDAPTVKEVVASMRKSLIKREQDQPSTLDLLRQDRER